MLLVMEVLWSMSRLVGVGVQQHVGEGQVRVMGRVDLLLVVVVLVAREARRLVSGERGLSAWKRMGQGRRDGMGLEVGGCEVVMCEQTCC